MIAHGEPGGLAGRNAIYRIRPRRFVIAMGAVERPIAFVDNDRPGVMLLGAAERLLARYGVAVGQAPATVWQSRPVVCHRGAVCRGWNSHTRDRRLAPRSRGGAAAG